MRRIVLILIAAAIMAGMAWESSAPVMGQLSNVDERVAAYE